MQQTRTAIVTGASSGIGGAIAKALENVGYKVYGTSRTNPQFLKLDVRDEVNCIQLVEQMIKDSGRIDVLVNNAGYALLGAVADTKLKDVQDNLNTNFFGVLRMTKAVLPHMLAAKAGRIVNVSSIAGFMPVPFMASYAASKHALEGYSESLDHEVRSRGIRSILIEPGFVKTKIGESMVETILAKSDFLPSVAAFKAMMEASLNSASPPDDVAAIVLTALSSQNPKLRYTVGKDAGRLKALRRYMPTALFDRSLRKQFKIV
jgi:NAD(P)-dependent dehydrogenase (short-subunit alcohol dehydrogenase family)